MQRNSALVTVDRGDYGGRDWNYVQYSNMFKTYAPFNFGVKTSQLFSADPATDLVNKKFTYMTIAQKNYYVIDGGKDEYEWSMVGNTYVPATVTQDLLGANVTPGKGNSTFRLALDKDWYAEPVLLKTEDSNAPLIRIIGEPRSLGNNSWEYTCEVQSSNPNDYISPDVLQPGRTLIDISTSVSNSMNYKFGGDQYAQMFKLRSVVGAYSRGLTIDDRTIRAEIAARKKGMRMNKEGYDGVGVGYVFNQDFDDPKTRQRINQGVFITMAEAKLLNRVEQDREYAMEFGREQTTTDSDTGRATKVAPGWRQIVQDGHYKMHNGSLSLSDIYEYLSVIFFGRSTFADRHIRIITGEGGLLYMNRLLQKEFGSVLSVDTTIINKEKSDYNSNAYSYGRQFVKWIAPNGIIVELVYDPIKDNKAIFPELAPGSIYPIESFCMDIMDFGKSDQRATGATREENITMVVEDGVESYFTVSNVYDFATGAEKSGGNVYAHNKEALIQRELSGSLCVWDTSRIGRLEYVPDTSY
jgi:hypothetical protein